MDRRTFFKCALVSALGVLFPTITKKQLGGVIDRPTIFRVGAIPREPAERVRVTPIYGVSPLSNALRDARFDVALDDYIKYIMDKEITGRGMVFEWLKKA